MQYLRFALNITGSTPVLITPAPKQTAAQLIAALHRDITAGLITGDTSGPGGSTVLKVIDNADNGMPAINGLSTPTGNEIVVGQFSLLDTGVDGTTETAENIMKQIGRNTPTNAQNGAYGYIAEQPNLSYLTLLNAITIATPVPTSSSSGS